MEEEKLGCDCAQSGSFGGGLPFFNDDDDRAQQQNEDHQPPSADSENQPHVLRVLGPLQNAPVVFARCWRNRVSSKQRKEQNNNTNPADMRRFT